MAGELGVFLVLFVCLGIGGPLLLYVLVRQEHDDRQALSREDAERLARRDAGSRERGATVQPRDGKCDESAWDGRPDAAREDDRDDRDRNDRDRFGHDRFDRDR